MPGDSGLKQLIREKYPFPISHAYMYLDNRVDPNDRYEALLACFEVTLKTITSIGLANFMRDIQDDPTLGNADLFQDLLDTLSRPLSLGHWHALLRLALRPYAVHRERLVVPQLIDFYYRMTEHGNVKAHKQNVEVIQRFIQERNEEAHHRNRGQTSVFQRQSKLTELAQYLETLLRELQFLSEYIFLYVEHAEHHEGQWHYLANFVYGTSYPFQQRTWKTALGINSHRCLLVNEAKSAVLELDPFMIVSSEGRLQQPDIFFFDGVFSSGRVNYMSYHVGDYIEPADEGSPASIASDAINSMLKLLKNRIPALKDTKDLAEDRLSAVETYRKAVAWASEHGERQSISLDALRQFLNLPREEALKQERELEAQRGVEVEPEVEVPFEGVPSWANLAYYVLDKSGQEEMFYKDIAAEAKELKHQYDPDWRKGDSANVEGTVSHIMSQDPRFYKLRLGYYRLTKHNELLSNPSWANLAYFVLRHHDPKRCGKHLQEVTERAVALKEKYSDWRSEKAQTPSHTVSATMGMDYRFESMPERGYWRLAADEVRQELGPAVAETLAPSTRDQAYEAVLTRLAQLGEVKSLPFGRTYYALEDRIHLMFRFSKAHQRNGEIEYFLGVTPQYFERIDALGNGFMVLVLGAPDNVLLVPAETFAEWVKGLEPSGSGTWPISFYQSPDKKRIERWVVGQGREDVSALLNDYASLRRVLPGASVIHTQCPKASIRMADLLEVGLLKPGDEVYMKKRPDLRASIVDARFVVYKGKQWRYNDWGIHVTGWSAINVYREVVLARTGQTLDDLRRELRQTYTQRIQQFEALQQEGTTLTGESPPAKPKKQRAPRGESTSRGEFSLPVLVALDEMGGRGYAKEVVARVRTIMEHQFLEADFEVLPSGQPRWEKNTNWARYFLKEQRLLAPDSPRGVWEITEAGRAYLREHQWEWKQK
jgi:hypothetical protein